RYPEYTLEIQGDRETSALFERSVPLLDEYRVPIRQLTEAYRIHWNRPPQEYFEFVPPQSYTADPLNSVQSTGKQTWEVDLEKDSGVALTFELKNQIVGWPYFTIDAPAGTQIELMVHEGHEVGGPPLLNSHFHSWTRFTCTDGLNEFETFDYESLRWLQLHIHGSTGKVRISEVGVRRRIYPWPNTPEVICGEPDLQRLFDASVNTLHNSAQETIVDGMGRERQQYSGDVGHQLHAIYFTFGEHRQPARYLKTFSQGLTKDGYFLDCWPAYDRLARLMERQMDLTQWGPLLDHGIGFVFDNYHHYMYTGRLDDLREPYPRLLRFVEYLERIRRENGLLPVKDIGIPAVWIDHDAYRQQRHKQCAFNLYAAAMLEHALAPICRAFGDADNARKAEQFSSELLQATIGHFWSAKHGLFVNNLPWLSEEQGIRLCDRSLATAILFDQYPGNSIEPSVRTLVNCPGEMGFSYPANAGWRLWALGKAGRQDVILGEFRQRWATMDSVILNNTLQENWEVNPDSGAQWSHCPVAPLYVLYMNLLGLKPLEPAFQKYEVRPRLADIGDLDIRARFPGNDGLHFKAQGPPDRREIMITTPSMGSGELVVRTEEQIDLETIPGEQEPGWSRYVLPAGEVVRLHLSYS
ncbi:MAG TPA: alpha-L-rhamnosidase, partial [bacterium]|nr:alpha-L-rhamnosidase [bacterium]